LPLALLEVSVTLPPAQNVVAPPAVIVGVAGVGLTVRVAAVVVVEPQLLVNCARYCLALSPDAVVKLYVVEVAPVTLLNVAPPSVETCHCTVPLAAAVKVAVVPLQAV
jgi:hypothetical protein